MDVTSSSQKKGGITKMNGGWKRGGVSEDTYCVTITSFCLFGSCEDWHTRIASHLFMS